MSEDNKNPDPFDFDFDALNEENPLESTGSNSFDLDNPFGEDLGVSVDEVSTNNPFLDSLDNSATDSLAEELLSESAGFAEAGITEELVSEGMDIAADAVPLEEKTAEKKKGLGGWFSKSKDKPVKGESAKEEGTDAGEEKTAEKKKGLGGWFSKSKDKPAKEESAKEEEADTDEGKTAEKKKGLGGWFSKSKDKPAKEKKEKIVKEKEGEPVPRAPRDWGAILCIALSFFLLVSLLMFNIATFLTSGNSILQTLCFLGAFNIVALAVAAVPILFYKYPEQRTVPNVMLGVSTAAMFCSVLIAVSAFYQYNFVLGP
jgi:hypothetical protein